MRESETERENEGIYDILNEGWSEAPWGFRGKEDNSQNNKKGRCSVIRSLFLPTDRL